MEVRKSREARQSLIKHKLELFGSVSVADITEETGISEVTIRKDLDEMEAQGLLTRIQGGAVTATDSRSDSDLFRHVPQVPNLALKHRVAKEASKLISDGDSLIVTSGATPHLTLLYASDRRNLKIVTDSLRIAEDICSCPDYQTIILGGEISTKYHFVHGRDAVRQAGKYMADKAILTMDGVDADAGITTIRVEGADTLKSILARARKRIIVADSTKIGVENFCNIGGISVVDILVTNKTDDPRKCEILNKIERAGVRVIYAD